MKLTRTLATVLVSAVLAAATLWMTPDANAWGGCASCAGPVGPQFSIPPLYFPAPPAQTQATASAQGNNPDVRCSGACSCGCQSGGECHCLNAHIERAAKATPVRETPVPAATGALPGDHMPTGVREDKVAAPDDGGYSLNGSPVNKAQAIMALEAKGGAVPDDSAKDSIVVVADDATRPGIVSALSPEMMAQCVVQAFTPDDWHVAGYKWRAPCVVRQRPDGTVVWKVEAEAATPEKVHVIDPNYDPAKDADPTKLTIKPVVVPPDLSSWAWAAGGLAGGLCCLSFFGLVFLAAVMIIILAFRGRSKYGSP